MTRRMRIAALGLLFAVAVPVVSAEEPGPFSKGTEPSSVIRVPVAAARYAALRPIAPADPDEVTPPATPHRPGELDCRQCHIDEHQGILRMYIGTGGRGAPMIPSHMFQVRVECIACHIVPKETERGARIVGQTFRPSEEACVNCHGEKYRGMLARWTNTLDKMRRAVTPKLAGVRETLRNTDPKAPTHARAQQLVADAEFNIEFVALAKGVHNVFYAADLIKLANTWLDESFRLLGKAPIKTDDVLVRGGYCRVLCHEQAGVRLPEAVTFGKQKIPHGRHVSEFGAVCTDCHSAEVHKAVTATAGTCASCHHSPQNERCESCHRTQAAFYRGETETALVAVDANSMAALVGCTGCHDFTTGHSRQAVGRQCLACHDEVYMAFMEEWTTGFDEQMASAARVIKQAEAAIAKARRAGRRTPEADALVRDAREALALIKSGRGAHNPDAAVALLETARREAEEALAQAGRQ